MTKFWCGVVSREHIRIGVAGGFIQLCHGKAAPLRRLAPGDGLVIYSPRTAHPAGQPLQAFTAIGRVTGHSVYQVAMAPGFEPYRRDVAFQPCREAPIRPLLPQLSFVDPGPHWGAAFRFGYLPLPVRDFERIAQAMALPADDHAVPAWAECQPAHA